MKRRNPAFIIQIFLFWYNSTIEERENPLLQDIFHKLRVTNLTQGGLKAMEELSKGRDGSSRQVASNEMCTFLILNISSLQLIPVNIIAYRSQYGSVNPTAVIGPALVATTVRDRKSVV